MAPGEGIGWSGAGCAADSAEVGQCSFKTGSSGFSYVRKLLQKPQQGQGNHLQNDTEYWPWNYWCSLMQLAVSAISINWFPEDSLSSGNKAAGSSSWSIHTRASDIQLLQSGTILQTCMGLLLGNMSSPSSPNFLKKLFAEKGK